MQTRINTTRIRTWKPLFFYNEAACSLRSIDQSKVYDEIRLNSLWGRDTKLLKKAYDTQLKKNCVRKNVAMQIHSLLCLMTPPRARRT